MKLYNFYFLIKIIIIIKNIYYKLVINNIIIIYIIKIDLISNTKIIKIRNYKIIILY